MAPTRRAPSGGDDWYRAVYEEHATQLLAYFLRRTRPDQAHDLVAEVFLVAWRRRRTAPDGPELRVWLFKVARNVLRNHRRGLARRLRLDERLRAAAVTESTSSPFDPTDTGARLRWALTRLREPDREILRLAAWEDCTTRDLAIVLGCSPNGAAVRLHRARRRLRDVLTADARPPRAARPRRLPTAPPGHTGGGHDA